MKKGTMIGLAAAALLILLARRGEAAPPEPPPPPPPPVKANLYGKITDSATGQPLGDVGVVVSDLVVYTGANGSYEFLGLDPGGYTVTFGQTGYESTVASIVLVKGNNELNVSLIPISIPSSPFTFSNVSAEKVSDIAAPAFYTMEFRCKVTNPSEFTVTRTLHVKYKYQGYIYDQGWSDWYKRELFSFVLSLAPGQSHDFFWDGNKTKYPGPVIAKRTRHCMWLEDGEGNKSAEGCVYRG